ncbi:MAG: TRAP transporter small permease subunit, partial [Pseudomonadota bacterium]
SGLRVALVWAGMVATLIAIVWGFSYAAVDLSPPGFSLPGITMAGITLLLGSILIQHDAHTGLAHLRRAASQIVTTIGKLTFIAVLAMALIQFTVVVLRYVFGINSIAMQESVTYMHGTAFLLAAGYALLHDDHVRVDIFYSRLSPRRKAIVNLAGVYVFLFPFCLLTIFASGDYVANAWSSFEGSTEQSGIQGIFLLKSLIPAFATLLALAGFSLAVASVETLNSGSQ